MPKRAFIIHGWNSSPQEGWLPWLKKELESRGFEVTAPQMPDPERPKMDAWVQKLAEVVKDINSETYLLGYSIGCQTILRYLETLPKETRMAGAILVAPWITLTDEAWETDEDPEIARPWVTTPIDWPKVRTKVAKFTAIFSTNDPFVPLEENIKIFGEKLGAEIIVEEKILRSDGTVGPAGHFSGRDRVTELPSALNAIP